MHFSPTKLFYSLLYITPVVLLTLAACGGGGGGGTTPVGPYALSVNVTGLSGSGLILRNNGGDDLAIPVSGVYAFGTALNSGENYNVSVLNHPNSPVQVCTVPSPTGVMPSGNHTVAVNCVNAYLIGGTIKGDSTLGTGIGPILQNNGGDDLFISTLPAAAGTVAFTFPTPVAAGSEYRVTQLSRARSPGQDCSNITPVSGVASASSSSAVTITCVSAPIIPKFAYTTNSLDNKISAFEINATSGAIAVVNTLDTGLEPYSVSVDPTGRYAYVANHSSNNITAYSISSTSGALSLIDANGAVSDSQGSIATETYPISLTVHPSGKFAYVVNETSASISAYSINSANGSLSPIDADGAIGTQGSIATGTKPYSVTIHPTGKFAYVANYGDGLNPSTISVYSINLTSGSLSLVEEAPAGKGPSSVAVDSHGLYLVVADNASNDVKSYTINSTTGALTLISTVTPPGINPSPRAVAIDPNSGIFVYVANAGTDKVTTYALAGTGALTGGTNIDAGGTPVSANVDPSGQFLYVSNLASSSVSVYSITSGTGVLTRVNCGNGVGCVTAGPGPTDFFTGGGPTSVTTTQ